MFSFYSDDSYELIKCAPDFVNQKKKKFNMIPALNLNLLPDYQSSSDEEEVEEKP